MNNKIKFILLGILFFSITIAALSQENEMFQISFIDTTPYQKGFWFFSKDHFRVELKIINSTNSTFIFEKFTFSGIDGNPKFFVKSAQNNNIISPKEPWEYDYFFDESFFIELNPNDSIIDTIDIEKYCDFEFDKGDYKLWFEYEPPLQRLYFLIKNPEIVWKKNLVSDTLYFKIK